MYMLTIRRAAAVKRLRWFAVGSLSILTAASVGGLFPAYGITAQSVTAPTTHRVAGLALYQQTMRRLQSIPRFSLTEVHSFYDLPRGSRACTDVYKTVRFQAPNRLTIARGECASVGGPNTEYTIQVGGTSCASHGKLAHSWSAASDLFLGEYKHPYVSGLVLILVALPPGHIGELQATAGLTETFGRVFTANRPINGRELSVDVVPVTLFRVYQGDAVGVPDTRERGRLFIDRSSGLPTEYVSSTRTVPRRGKGVHYAAERIVFSYRSVAPINLPGRGGRGC